MRIARAQHYNCPIQILISFPPKSSLKCPSCQTVYNSQDGGWETSLLPCPIVDQINTKGAIIIKPSYGSIQE
uniref:Uncharacterized protein n=1 Tax=Caenorhabditis japonica TaxID=281687 RepID=A0A8R1IBH1_CAEJA